ncbi:MAG: UDP-N-acetylmuramoyl-L-alanyl-D-glutamate--2,6-diaminopimelate ligase [Deltaproteobacteria bacterium]|nr:UDP-N-acetylmuramoyl-L-alanyl-D-glutamate--2,6-diaminopimelate ligase [Deltaproteobacteria bacterium]
MRINELIEAMKPVTVSGPSDVKVDGLFYDSRKVLPGGVFFALPGAKGDGCDYVDEALKRGAAAVVSERMLKLPPSVVGVVAKNARHAMAMAALQFFGHPLRDMMVIGVTGTNGKTTISYHLEAVLRAAGRKPAVLGTINYRYGDCIHTASHTTPESIDLLAMIAEFKRLGADSIVMEVSSHGLDQHRIDGFEFDVAAFTNLSPEHLDYHHDMESYFQVKKRLFTDFIKEGGHAAINVDDAYGARLAGEVVADTLTCGKQGMVRPGAVESSFDGIRGTLETPRGTMKLESRLFGSYNLSNLMVTTAVALAAGLPLDAVSEGIRTAYQVPGRLEKVENSLGATVVVDYAHTPDGLRSVLTALRELRPARVLAVFGCGGDRDRSKRPLMGEAVAQLADLVILTSDNPRSEDPLAILEEIKAGVVPLGRVEKTPEAYANDPQNGFVALPDRREAIRYAISLVQEGDVLLIAGKGHEDYQIVGSKRLHFDDREEACAALQERMTR